MIEKRNQAGGNVRLTRGRSMNKAAYEFGRKAAQQTPAVARPFSYGPSNVGNPQLALPRAGMPMPQPTPRASLPMARAPIPTPQPAPVPQPSAHGPMSQLPASPPEMRRPATGSYIVVNTAQGPQKVTLQQWQQWRAAGRPAGGMPTPVAPQPAPTPAEQQYQRSMSRLQEYQRRDQMFNDIRRNNWGNPDVEAYLQGNYAGLPVGQTMRNLPANLEHQSRM